MTILEDILGGISAPGRRETRKVRVGILGEGPELALLTSAFKSIGTVSSVVYFHPDSKKAAATASALGLGSPASDIGDLASRVDAAEILAFDGRTEAAESLLLAGKHVSIRKPLAETPEDAAALERAARRGKASLRVDDEAFFFQPIVKLKHLVDSMEIGEICAARFRVNIVGGGSLDPLKRLLKSDNYLFHPCFDCFALAIYFFGDIESVIAYLNPMDMKRGGQGMVCCKFKDPGRYGVFELTYSPGADIRADAYPCDFSIETAGTDGIIWMNHFYGKMTETPWLEVRRGKKYYSMGIGSGMEVSWASALKASATHFATRAAADAPPRADIRIHSRALKVLLAAAESASTKKEIRV
jgi:predicted dehydrogenase